MPIRAQVARRIFRLLMVSDKRPKRGLPIARPTQIIEMIRAASGFSKPLVSK